MDTNKIFIDMAQRADKFAEMCWRMAKEADPEAWREECRKKQAAGVKFERCWMDGTWHFGVYDFNGPEKDYREVPQEVSAECQNALEYLAKTYSADKGTAQLNPTIPPHAAERALWKAQREAGTNEVWQWAYVDDPKKIWTDIRVDHTPTWQRSFIYRAKPMKLTARICMVGKAYPMSYIGQDWEFTGTREEYRAECEKYGYAILSEIKEVKSKMVKNYSVLVRLEFPTIEAANDYVKGYGMDIIGNIEEREVEA